MSSRRPAFALAAVLTAMVLTGAFAAAGLVHRPAAGTPAPVVQIAPQPTAPSASTWVDD
jgi:hypothetical protein